jgi:hypothetical protein
MKVFRELAERMARTWGSTFDDREYTYPAGLAAPDGPCHRCASPSIIGFVVGRRILCLCESCVVSFTDAFVADGPAAALEGMVRDLELSHATPAGTA